MTRAVVKVYASATAAAREALRLKGLQWSAVYSGPDDGVDVMDGNTELASSAKQWIVLATKSGITPA